MEDSHLESEGQAAGGCGRVDAHDAEPGWRVLLVEDDPFDADLLRHALKREVQLDELRRVDSAEAFCAALDEGGWTVVLSDYHVPGFGAPVALPLFRERGLDIPFIVVSGQVGDETAAGLLRDGADDFVMKGNLRRLLPAIRQAQQRVADRVARVRAETELAASRERLRELAAFLQTVREDERAHIARELHDELGQMLTALRLDLADCASRLSPEQSELAQRLAGARGQVQGMVDAVKRIYADLRPPILDDLGLAAAIEWLVADVAARAGLAHECYISDPDFNPPPPQGITLYRAVQEALTNAVRHAGATRVDVSLVVRADVAHLHVRDDGRGFDINRPRPRSFGLLGMQERVRAAGGRVQIDSEEGKGTTVHVRLPPLQQQGEQE